MANRWTEVLPEVWQGNPDVVVVTAPVGAKSRVMIKRNGTMFGVLEQTIEGRGVIHTGIQVIAPELKSYVAHEDLFSKSGLFMLPPRYIGPLADVSSGLLCGDLAPLLLLRDNMGFPYLDLVSYLKSKVHPKWQDNGSLC